MIQNPLDIQQTLDCVLHCYEAKQRCHSRVPSILLWMTLLNCRATTMPDQNISGLRAGAVAVARKKGGEYSFNEG